MQYKIIDSITSDVLFEAYGKDLKEVFENSAIGLFTVICHDVKPEIEKVIEVDGTDEKDLLYNWLQMLIAMVDIEEMFFSKFEITEITETKLKAKIYGESTTPEKGETVVKAVTYHQFDLKKIDDGYTATVSVDI